MEHDDLEPKMRKTTSTMPINHEQLNPAYQIQIRDHSEDESDEVGCQGDLESGQASSGGKFMDTFVLASKASSQSGPELGKRLKRWIWNKKAGYLAIVFLYHIYLGYAIFHHIWQDLDWGWCDGLGFLILLTGMVHVYNLIFSCIVPWTRRSQAIQDVSHACRSYSRKHLKNNRWFAMASYGLVLLVIAIFLILDTVGNRQRLISAGGIVILVLFGALCSKHPKQIRWRQVTWGLVLQFAFALIILRWDHGKNAIQCIGAKVDRFLGYTDVGSSFIYGYLVHRKPFIPQLLPNESLAYNVTMEINNAMATSPVAGFKALSVIFFFSFICNVLFYLGAVQWATLKVGWLLKVTIGTTACESLNAASNIFLGQAMAPLLIEPYLPKMTRSEIHSIMTSGFATIAGTVMAAYITFGVSAAHLVSASVMSAPAALACAKLLYPETEQSQTSHDSIKLKGGQDPEGDASNILDAATRGASMAANLVLNITAIVIAFIALIAFLNELVAFFFSIIGFDDVNFELLLGKLFRPLAFIMGVDWKESEAVGKLIGIKTVVNEFIAYRQLGVASASGQLSPRSVAIATYALCGFANPASVGIQLAILRNLCPEKKAVFANIIGRAFIAGSMACFLTACIAGALLTEDGIKSSGQPTQSYM
eukprot:snap_masked-scaffold23_size669530-processed-gene-0.5 protein:Tk11047 transcript:snap_masked-scaffold23_size669530-processed-gene-0.5-mRNA-1 annotation:"sodium nucleoside cotransporter 1"